MICFVGCYTDDAHPEGIHVIDVNPESGALRRLSSVRLQNAIYQAQSPCGRYLISCMRGGLAAFRIKDDALVPSDRMEWGGQCLCHVSVMPDGKRVCWADYLAGEAGSIGFDEGRFVVCSMIRHRHEGCGPNLPRQASAHCHQAIPLPDGNGYAVVDLGLDRISVYPQDCHFPTEPKGAGPRHLAYHPTGRFAFLASELGNIVSIYRLARDGCFECLTSESTLPEGWKGESAVAAIRVSSDGRRVYVSNRGHDSIATFGFCEKSERLTRLSVTPLSGAFPRDFDFLPDGRVALATLERSGMLVSLRCDGDTGGFSEIAVLGGFYRPSSVSILSRPR